MSPSVLLLLNYDGTQTWTCAMLGGSTEEEVFETAAAYITALFPGTRLFFIMRIPDDAFRALLKVMDAVPAYTIH